MDGPDWSAAKCRYGDGEGAGPEVMYQETGVGAERAKRICWGVDDGVVCSCRRSCLEKAIIENEVFGVWGGHGQRERIKVRAVWKETGVIRDLPKVRRKYQQLTQVRVRQSA